MDLDLDATPSDVNPTSNLVDATTTNLAITSNDDLAILPSDDAAIQPSMGSSRISGGIIRGRATGNVPKHADITTTSLEFNTPVKGEVYLYFTELYPRYVKFELLKGDSELVVMVKVVGRMASILDMVARKFSIIQGECNLFSFFFLY